MTRGGILTNARGRLGNAEPRVAPRLGITDLLRNMHDVVASEATPQQRLDRLTELIARHVGADVCSIYLRRADDHLELYSTEGLKPEAVHKTVMAPGEGLVGQVCSTASPLVTGDAPLHPAYSFRPETGEEALHAFLGVPLIRSGRALGVLVLQNQKTRRYEDGEVGAAQAVATLLAEIAASGELLDETATQEVGEMLRLPERRRGVGVVEGVGIGEAWFVEPPTPKHNVFTRDPEREAARIDTAVDALCASLDQMLHESIHGSIDTSRFALRVTGENVVLWCRRFNKPRLTNADAFDDTHATAPFWKSEHLPHFLGRRFVKQFARRSDF
ncbi:MAG: GAF domain-containing protein, partial [Pseudomonadota bacterium]